MKTNAEFKEADDELNNLYRRIKKTLSKEDFEKFRTVQRDWIKNGDIYRAYFIIAENMTLEKATIANTKMRVKDFQMILDKLVPVDYISVHGLTKNSYIYPQ